jgi:hypothetical protein
MITVAAGSTIAALKIKNLAVVDAGKTPNVADDMPAVCITRWPTKPT